MYINISLISDLLLGSLIIDQIKKEGGEMMKKGIIKTFAFALIISLAFGSINFVYAAMVQKGIGYKEIISLGETVPEYFHTTLYPRTVEAGPVTVENTVQRKNSNNVFVNVGRGYLSVNSTNKSMHLNFSNAGTKLTRFIWVNQTRNSYVSGDWYLDPNHMN